MDSNNNIKKFKLLLNQLFLQKSIQRKMHFDAAYLCFYYKVIQNVSSVKKINKRNEYYKK